MASTLTIRSHAGASRSPNPYSPPAIPRATSNFVAQARLQRFVDQAYYWGGSQSQGAETYANTNEKLNSAREVPSIANDTRGKAGAITEYHNTFAVPCTPDDSPFLDHSFKVAFAPPSTPNDFQISCSVPESPPKIVDSYSGDYRALLHPASTPTPQVSPFARTVDIAASAPNQTNASPAPMQRHHHSPIDYATIYPRHYVGSSSMLYDNCYQPTAAPAHSHSDRVSPSFNAIQAPYSDQQCSDPQHTVYDDRRGSVTSTISSDCSYDYQTYDTSSNPYTQSTESSPTLELTYICAPSVSIVSSSSGEVCNVQSYTSSVTHTSSPYHVSSGQSAQISTATSSGIPRLPSVGSTESVQRRVGIMLQTQQCQQGERHKRNSFSAQEPAKISDGRRDKLNPTSDDSKVPAIRGTSLSPKDPVTKYKAAYERVKLQRDFYERAASSLVHQVRMLGGDPMQASKLASKGEELDPKGARILIASLQRELESSRGKLIETQTELHALRQSCDESSHSYTRSLGGDYYLRDEEDSVPLSAAPSTVYNHYRS